MKESGVAALTYARGRAAKLGFDESIFQKHEVHIHVPAGAIPKDGPSAGIAIATAILSLATRTPVRSDVAMTGEVTLRGRVLPIGGVRDKALAALRAGITTVIMPKKNMQDLHDFPKELRRKMNFVPVEEMDQVIAVAFEKKEGERKKEPSRPRRRRSSNPITSAKPGTTG
jgi:ATP-dependent Lon protease